MMLIIGVLFLVAGIGIGITDKEYGAMALGIVLGAFLIWYSPKAKAKKELRKQEYQAQLEMYNQSDDGYYSSSSSGIGKVGYRTPSLSKSISAKTTGNIKRKVKSTLDPTYNVKGMGYIKNPKRAIKNKLYKKKTKSLF